MQDSGISESDDGLLCHETSLSRVAFVLGAFSSESCCVIGLNSRQALRALNAINLYPPRVGSQVRYTTPLRPNGSTKAAQARAGIALPPCLQQVMSSQREASYVCRAIHILATRVLHRE